MERKEVRNVFSKHHSMSTFSDTNKFREVVQQMAFSATNLQEKL